MLNNKLLDMDYIKTQTNQVVNSQSSSQTNAYSCNYVNSLVNDVYSTSEIKTNKVWIDGKPIYRKVITFSRSNHEQFIVSIGSSVDKLVFIDGYAYGNNDLQHGLYHVSDGDQFRYYVNGKTTLNVVVGSNFPSIPFTGYFVVEYTKTSE